MLLKRLVSAVISLFFLSLFISSFAFLILHSEHRCENEHCPICTLVEMTRKTLKILGSAPKFVSYYLNAALCMISLVFSSFCFFSIHRTPVFNKVKLNN